MVEIVQSDPKDFPKDFTELRRVLLSSEEPGTRDDVSDEISEE
jgi:hypothetical protein